MNFVRDQSPRLILSVTFIFLFITRFDDYLSEISRGLSSKAYARYMLLSYSRNIYLRSVIHVSHRLYINER